MEREQNQCLPDAKNVGLSLFSLGKVNISECKGLVKMSIACYQELLTQYPASLHI